MKKTLFISSMLLLIMGFAGCSSDDESIVGDWYTVHVDREGYAISIILTFKDDGNFSSLYYYRKEGEYDQVLITNGKYSFSGSSIRLEENIRTYAPKDPNLGESSSWGSSPFISEYNASLSNSTLNIYNYKIEQGNLYNYKTERIATLTLKKQ